MPYTKRAGVVYFGYQTEDERVDSFVLAFIFLIDFLDFHIIIFQALQIALSAVEVGGYHIFYRGTIQERMRVRRQAHTEPEHHKT